MHFRACRAALPPFSCSLSFVEVTALRHTLWLTLCCSDTLPVLEREASSEPPCRCLRPGSRGMTWALPLWPCANQSLTSIQRHFNSVAPCESGHYKVIFSLIFLTWKIVITLLYNYVTDYLYYPYLSFSSYLSVCETWSSWIQMPIFIYLPKCVII